MILESGNILSNFRTRTLSNTIVESDITGELQTVEEFEEFVGIYGFRLNEVPRTDLQGITSVTRNEDNQVFTWVASDTPGTNQYGFDYNNPLPNVYLPSSEVGKVFTIAYKGTGGAYSSKNIISLSSLSGDLHERLINSIRNKPLDYSLVNQNIFTYNKVVTVNNLTITGTCTIRTNNPSSFGIVEIMGDLTLANFATLKTIRVMLIIHGSINVPIGTAEIIGNNGYNGGNGSLTLNGGGGGAGTGQEGDNAAVINTGGSGGFCLIDQYSPTNAPGGIINTAGANGLGGNGGGGGGAAGAGGNALLGGGSGGGGSGSFSAGVLGANSILHGSGGRGGDGAGGTIGGVGGGSGGSSVICIILGDLPTGLTMRAGKNGLNGTVGNLTGSIQPYSGNILLYSRYTNANIPTTLDVSPNGAGYAGTLYREQIGQSAKMTGYILNNILSELGSYGVTDFGIGNKLAGDV